jgi:predicted Zn-dependent protease
MCEICDQNATTVAEPRWGRRDTMRALVGGAAALALPACQTTTNAETGRGQFIIVSDERMAQAALQAWAQMRQQTPPWNNRAAQDRLQRVGMNIARGAGRGSQAWEFQLFDSPQKNAFVLPGNKVGYFRGLYEMSEREDWMGTVLGHEVGHVTGRHAAERYSREMATQTALQIAGTQIDNRTVMAALGLGAQVGVSLPFSRDQEGEADILGLNYMHTAGYDVKQAIPFWAAMSSGGGSRPPELLSTHPDPANRIERIRAHINSQGWGPV